MADWPACVYLETSILRSLPVEMRDADFLQLKDLTVGLKIPIVVPQVCIQELAFHRQREVRADLGRAESAVGQVARYLHSQPSLVWGEDRETIVKNVQSVINRHLTEHGILIALTPDLSLERLIGMAIEKTRPFEEKGEKGFRDAIILFTVIDHAKQTGEGICLLVSADAVFRHPDIQLLANAEGVDLRVVESLQDATSNLKQFISAAMRAFLEERAARLTEFLQANREQIVNFIVDNGEFTESFLFSDQPLRGMATTIRDIENIELLSIENTQPGILAQGTVEGRTEISFDARLKFTLLAEARSFPRTPRFRVRGREAKPFDVGELFQTYVLKPLPGEERLQREEIERTVRVSGSAQVNNLDEYADLQLERVGGSTLIETLMGT